MIIVRLEGGLGNQMFQYAIGRQLSIINKTELKFDLISYKSERFENKAFFRGYCLDVFDLNIDIASSDEIEEVKETKISYFENLKYRLKRLKDIPYFRKPEIFETNLFSFDKNILKVRKNTYLTGYWQSPEYFNSIRDILLADFKFREIPMDTIYNYINKIGKEESVSIHVRRGDYINNPETFKLHGVCGLDYYQSAIEYITKKINTPIFYVFSDDIRWAEENIRSQNQMIYVKETPQGKDYFDMYLMSICKHNIIANSSFSWWGAWLNKSPEKIVIAPEKWMNDVSIDTTDLIPKSWVRI